MKNPLGTESNVRRQFMLSSSASVALWLALGASTRVRAQSVIDILHVLSSAAPGSAPDLLARRISDQLSGGYARRAIVENRPGAAGRIAMNALKLAPTDGSTVWLASGSITTINPYVHPKLGYDPVLDLQAVSMAAEMPLALAVGPAVPASVGDVRGLIDWMQQHPDLANVASPGVGSTPHLLAALLFREAGLAWQHVAYPGGAPMVVALLGGQVAAVVLPEALLGPHRAGGRLRVLATSGPARTKTMPDVPTFVEQGHRELVVQEWFAFFMLRGVAQSLVEAASQAIHEALARPALSAALAELGMVALSSTPAAVTTRIAKEQKVWGPLIRAAGIRSDA